MTDFSTIPGAYANVVGTATGPVEERTFDNGSVAQFSVAVDIGYKNSDGEWVKTGTNFYTIKAKPDWADENWPEIEAGDKVRIEDARQTVRPYIKNNGEAGAEIELRFGTVVVLERKADRPAKGSGTFASSAATPF